MMGVRAYLLRIFLPSPTTSLALSDSHTVTLGADASASMPSILTHGFLNALIDNSGAIIYVKDHQARFQLVNSRFETDLGLPRAAVLGKTNTELFGAEVARQFEKTDFQVLKDGKTVHVMETLTVGGQLRHYRSVKFPIYGPDGTLDAMCGMSTDVTDQQRAHQELAVSESRFRQMFNQHHIPKLLIDAQTGMIVEGNQAAEQFYGYDGSELKDRSIFDLTVSDTQRLMEKIATVQRDGMLRCELVHQSKNGMTRDVEVFAGKLEIENRELIYSIITDISESKQAQSLASQLMTIVERANVPIILTDTEGSITYLNEAATKLMGIRADEAVGRTGLAWLTNESRENLTGEAAAIARANGYWMGRSELLTRDRAVVSVMHALVSRLDADGRFNGFASILSDVSELEHTMDVLRVKNEELLLINEELDKFVYSTSHDLRAPLMAVIGLIDLTLDHPEVTEAVRENLHLMRSSIQRSDTVIRNILDYSRNNRVAISVKPTRIRDMVMGYVDSIRHLPMARNVRFESDIDPDAVLHTDPVRLESILSNLISNAYKYQRSNHPEPLVKVRYRKMGHWGEFRITDNGIGIPEKFQNRLFGMFSRLTEQSDGSGLGLFIAASMARKLDGSIVVDSTEGVGSTFTILIPDRKA